MDHAISNLVGEELEEEERRDKWKRTLAAPNGSLYGIPCRAGRIAKLNPLNKSMTHIGPDFGRDLVKWERGTMADNGIIYCLPSRGSNHRGILKIDTNTDTAIELDRNILPGRGCCMWVSCAAALDGCIYFMPWHARRILKLDPMNNVAICVGDDLGDGLGKYLGIVVGIDGCVYGMPYNTNRIVKYDPINDTTSFVGEEADGYFVCPSNGALGRDGCIYAFTAKDNRVLKIDTTNNSHCFVGNSIQSEYEGWGDAILGIDGCIYWPPTFAHHILKFDPHTNQNSLVVVVFESWNVKWSAGCLASDGVIYCIPNRAGRILSIDPWKEFRSSIKMNIQGHQEQLGYLFHLSDDIPNETNFDRAVTKFGHKRILKWLEECLPPPDRLCTGSNLYPFMILASCKESDVSVIYHFLRQVPSFVNSTRHHAGHTRTHTASSGKKLAVRNGSAAQFELDRVE